MNIKRQVVIVTILAIIPSAIYSQESTPAPEPKPAIEATPIAEIAPAPTEVEVQPETKPEVEPLKKPEKLLLTKEWKKVDGAKKYEIKITPLLPEKKLPTRYQIIKNRIKFKLLPGKYEFRFISVDKNNKLSRWSWPTTFWVGDPHPEWEKKKEKKEKKKNIDKTIWTVFSDIGFGMINYFSSNADTNTDSTFEGLSYYFDIGFQFGKKSSSWRHGMHITYAMATVERLSPTALAAQIFTKYRFIAGKRLMFSFSPILDYRDVSEIVGYALTNTVEEQKISMLGLGGQIESFFKITKKIGALGFFEMISHQYALKTPNNELSKPSVSLKLGALCSYRFSPPFTLQGGYYFKSERASYGASPTGTLASSGQSNTLDSTSHNFVIRAKYSF